MTCDFWFQFSIWRNTVGNQNKVIVLSLEYSESANHLEVDEIKNKYIVEITAFDLSIRTDVIEQNTVDAHQTLQNAASDQCLHYLPIIML